MSGGSEEPCELSSCSTEKEQELKLEAELKLFPKERMELSHCDPAVEIELFLSHVIELQASLLLIKLIPLPVCSEVFFSFELWVKKLWEPNKLLYN